MKFKHNVRIYDFLDMHVMNMLQVIQLTSPEGYEPTITSANDSKHCEGSSHYKDKGFDIRVRDYPKYSILKFKTTRHHIDNWIGEMRKYLPENKYKIIFGVRKHRDHIHINLI